MKRIFQKLTSAALAAVLLAGSLPAYASDALGHDLDGKNATVNAGTVLAEGTFWSDSHSDLRHENYVVYTPNTQVTPVVTYGETSRALTTVPAAAQELEAQGWRVVAGINGDYYDTKNGLPIGSTMVGGALRNISSDPYYAVGFRADGTAVIGDPQLSVTASVNGGSAFPIFAFNYIRHSEYGISLYDHSFNNRHTTGTSEPGVDVVCSAESGALTIGGQLFLRVDEVLPSAVDTVVPEGKYVLSVNLKAGESATALLSGIQVGDQIVLCVSSGAGTWWNDVTNLIGAPVLLVNNGSVCSGLAAGSAPRTAIGQRADGTLIFYTIDGRRSGYSIGATLSAVAMRLVELGCVTAVALDGGGSTTLVATMPDELTSRVVNTPSEALRAVTNHVFLVAPNTPSGIPGSIYLASEASVALPGADVALRAALLDTNYIPMTGTPLTLEASAGLVSGNRLILPAETGTVAVQASGGGLTQLAQIETVLPEKIVVRQDGVSVTSITVAPNSSAMITAEGVRNHLTLAGGNECFDISYEGDGATLLPDGTLVGGPSAAAGTLHVALGEQRVDIPVSISELPRKLLIDFESPFDAYADAEEEPKLRFSRTTAAAYVKLGKAAAKLEYTLDGENPLTVPVSYALAPGYNRAELWVYGNGGSASLSLETDAGSSAAAPLSFTGWQQVSLELPSGASQITGITVNGPNAVRGMFLIDQLVLSHSTVADATPPEVTLTLDAATGALTGRAFDAVDGAALPTVRLACDGKALEHSYSAHTGTLSAAAPVFDGLAHIVTLTAADASGNLARTSVYIPAAESLAPAFPDVEGHWAAGAVDYLKRSGISNGDDQGLYNPDMPITRQEFAAMLYRYLKPAQDFSGVQMPFVDKDSISGWALESARAMYALGIIGGSREADDQLYYKPRANITRQEAVTMLGRLLDKGYAVPALTYADSADVPAWAAEHVAILGAAGVFDDFVTDQFLPTQRLSRAEMAAMILRIN